MDLRFRIFRFDPQKDREPRFQTYTVSAEPGERLLDCLNRIRWEQDGTLAYRMSCAHGICGSDAMKINGVCALACQKLVKDFAGSEVLIEPLPGFRVLRDLIVDMEPFLRKVALVRPYLLRAAGSTPPEDGEFTQSREEQKKTDVVIRCILCACCTASCPVFQGNHDFLGPAALVWAFRYIFDSRDDDDLKRLMAMDFPNGAWGCENHFNCTRVCPKEIPVTKCINTIKREIDKRLRDGTRASGGK